MKTESEEVTLISSGHSNVIMYTHTHTHISAGVSDGSRGVKARSIFMSLPCWGLMMRNIIRCVMKTLNPQPLFQGGHFIDERWCYDSEGLQNKTFSTPQRGTNQEEAEDEEISTTPSV